MWERLAWLLAHLLLLEDSDALLEEFLILVQLHYNLLLLVELVLNVLNLALKLLGLVFVLLVGLV